MLTKDKTMLVVDDTKISRDILKNLLALLGYKNVIVASNGKEAKEILLEKGNEIQLVLLDWTMPEMDGMEFMRWKNSNEVMKSIPVIFCTARSEKDDILLALSKGVYGYLLKPTNLEILEEKLNYVNDLLVMEKELEQHKDKLQEMIANKVSCNELLSYIEQIAAKYQQFKNRIYLNTAEQCVQHNRINDAVTILQKCLAKAPTFVSGWLLMAKILWQRNQLEQAAVFLKKVLDITPNHMDALFLLGRIYLINSDFNRTRSIFIRIYNACTNKEATLERIVKIFDENECINKLFQIFPLSSLAKLSEDSVIKLIKALIDTSIEEAYEFCKRLVKDGMISKEILYYYSYCHFKKNNLKTALKYLEKLLKEYDDYEPAIKLYDKIMKSIDKKADN